MPELMRNYLGPATVRDLGQRIQEAYPPFNSRGFSHSICRALGEKSLTERIELITQGLEKYLPGDFPQAAKILMDSLGPELDDKAGYPVAKEYASSRGFVILPVTAYIARRGQAHFDLSMKALYEMTKRFSSESYIRDFILDHPQKVLTVFKKWSQDPNVHVRRLVSESTRPRLPWAKRLPMFVKDPGPVLQLLEKLKDDKHLYVRRSVANNLNDISKDNPEAVIQTLKRWNQNPSSQLTWLTKHALRTLIKKGHRGALSLVGISQKTSVALEALALHPAKLKFGSPLNISITLKSKQSQEEAVLVDYLVFHRKANGSLSPKVFKWTQGVVSLSAPLTLHKKHPLKPITTRKYYPGTHEVHIQVNGKVLGQKSFELTM